VLADVPGRLPRGHAVEYRDAGQRGAGPSPAAEARPRPARRRRGPRLHAWHKAAR